MLCFDIKEFKDQLLAGSGDLVSQYIDEIEEEKETISYLKQEIKNYRDMIQDSENQLQLAQSKLSSLVNNLPEFYRESESRIDECQHVWAEITDRSGMGGTGYYEKCILCGEEK